MSKKDLIIALLLISNITTLALVPRAVSKKINSLCLQNAFLETRLDEEIWLRDCDRKMFDSERTTQKYLREIKK